MPEPTETPTPEQRRELSAYEKICEEKCSEGCGKGFPRVIDDAEAHEPKWINWHYKVIDLRCNYIIPCTAPSRDTTISGLVREVERLREGIQAALVESVELREAWVRGVKHDHNDNDEIDRLLRAALAAGKDVSNG